MRPTIVAALLLLAGLAHAQAPAQERVLTLRRAIELALRQNPTLNATNADVAMADGAVTAARGMDDPLLEATGSWGENRQQLVSGTPIQQPALETLAGSVGLVQPLPTGGRVGVRSENYYNHTEFALESQSNPGQYDRQSSDVYAPSAQIMFQHPVLRGVGVNVARAERRRAAVRRDIAGLTRDAAVAALLRDVVVAYWNTAYSKEEYDIRRAWVGWAEEQLQRVQAAIEAGKQPPSASAEVQVVIARREEGVLFAEQAMIERSLDLKRLIGESIDSSFTNIQAADALSLPEADIVLAQALSAAQERNPQLRAAEAQGRLASIDVDVAENGLLPQLDIYLSGGPAGNADDPRRAYGALGQFSGFALTAGVTLQEPLGRHAARGAADMSSQALHKARLTEADIRSQLTNAVARGVVAADTARRRIDVLARSIEAAELDLEAEKARFESGRATNFDVLRRQDQLAQVKLSRLAARVDYVRALTTIEALTGDIGKRYGVRM